ncbi:thioredoxin family protein [bacterium]|nr:thioredoxin family protein [bacterium]
MSCCKQSGSDTCCELNFGQAAPDFNLPGVDGRNWSLADFKDKKALVVIFSCNHCPYVIKSEERMIELGKEYQPKGIGFVLISANYIVTHPQDSPENMKKRAEQKGYPFPYLYNEDQKVACNYGAQVTPHIFLFDSEMKLCYRGAIDDNINDSEAVKINYLRDAIEAILAGTPEKITNQETKPVGCSIKWK